MIDPGVLRDARQLLADLEQLAFGSTQRIGGDRVTGGEKSHAPAGAFGPSFQQPLSVQFKAKLAVVTSTDELRFLIIRFTEEAAAWRVRQDRTEGKPETWEQLRARIIREGKDWPVNDVAMALRLTPSQVRKARREAARELGRIKAFGRQKYSVREIAEIVSLPKSTVQDELRRAA